MEQFKNYPNGLELAVAGYNAGPGAVIKYGYSVPPYPETQAYVKKVLGYVQILGSSPAASTGSTVEAKEDPIPWNNLIRYF